MELLPALIIISIIAGIGILVYVIGGILIANLSGADTSVLETDEKMIICADDLAPSETVSLDKDKVS